MNRSDDHRATGDGQPGDASREPAADLEDLSSGPSRPYSGPGQGAASGPSRSFRESGVPPARPVTEATEAPAVGKTGQTGEATSPGQRVALAIGLSLGALGAAVPALVLLWSVFALLAKGVTAEALEQTRGLEGTTFGGGYWLAVTCNGLCVLASLIRLARKQPAPWRPLAWLSLSYVVLLWTLVPADWAGISDVPDVLTTFALLGANMLINYALPVVLLVLLLRGARVAWRIGYVLALPAQRITALSMCLGLAGMSVTGALVAAGAEGYFDELAPSEEDMESLAATFVEGERQAMVELSRDIGQPAPLPGGETDRTRRFAACAKELADTRARERSDIDKAVADLIRYGLSAHDAEDVVGDALLAVCLQYSQKSVDELTPYFRRVVKNRRNKRYRRIGREMPLDDESEMAWDDDPETALEKQREVAAVIAARERLSESDRHVLHLYEVDELSHKEIGAMLGKSEVAVRQQVKRARNRLRHEYDKVLTGR